ncbi:MAG: glycoside hydrolase family 13 protein [Oscillospiraceae bacterium]|jgi:4-alpha-glucanotransferase|nr:glycoside hydrolase family 13 protein [Oscillospiraceae bacterium]
MRPIHNSRDVFYRDPVGAVPAGTNVRLRALVRHAPQPDSVTIRVWSDREDWIEMSPLGFVNNGYLYETILAAPSAPGLVWYDFRIRSGGVEISYGNAPDKLGGEGAVWAELPPSFQLTVYDPAFAPPKWMREAVVYQIFPDRFEGGPLRPSGGAANPANPANPTQWTGGERLLHADWHDAPGMGIDPDSKAYRAQDFYGGTLEGIRRALPYLAGLGVTCLYLNPIFEAPSNHRYDTTDYLKIDPMLGTERDLIELCESARDAGIRVMLDGVFSHVGAGSAYFRDAVSCEDSRYRRWFTFKHWPDDYDCWWGVPSLPNVNEMEPSYLDFTLRSEGAVVPRWTRSGVAGWRLDVADELPMPFLRELRAAVKRENPDACVLGEVWENASCKIAYGELRSYVLGDTLDSVMNYPLRSALISFLTGTVTAPRTARRIDAMMEQYPKPFAYALMNLMGSHDRARVLNELACVTGESTPRASQGALRLTDSQRTLARERLLLMFGFIAAWPGMPTVYYGDEAGMEGAGDPYCRAAYPWGREDAGIREYFREAIELRQRSPVLITGEARLAAPDDDVLVIVREIRGGVDALGDPAHDALAVFAMNRGDDTKILCTNLPNEPRGLTVPPRGRAMWLSGDHTVSTPFSASIIFSICSSAPVSASM